MIGGGDALALRDRGCIGDTGTAALVAADGTIDWWCPGRFDAPAALFRLLDPEGAAVRTGPAGVPRLGTQAYDASSNVLRTRLPGPEGELELADFFPWQGGRPSGRMVRLLTALRGRVEVDVDVVPGVRFGGARDVFTWSGGISFDGVAVQTGCPMERRHGRLVLEAGDRAVVVIEAVEERRREPVSVDRALDLLERTNTAWRSHLAPLTYEGPYRREVERSLLVLKSLTYAPTGAVVASPTTSLPERIGGQRNWDYRYGWLRDSCLAANANRDLGLVEAAEDFVPWLLGILRSSAGGSAGAFPLRPVFDVDGLPLDPGDEHHLALRGWRGSQPVRVGNAAADHLQLDFYADIVAALHAEQLRGPHGAASDLWEPLAGMADWLSEAWRRPDRGIWEIRCEPRHLVSSKLACWYALDRMVHLARARNPLDLDAVTWLEASREVAAWLDMNGRAAGGGLRSDTSPADRADGSLVRTVWRSPWRADGQLVARTIDRVISQLGSGPFVYRYDDRTPDGLPPGEGAHLACSFWMVEALARSGRWEEAHDRMESLCSFSRPLGLLPEQADPVEGSFLGNLPYALSHLTLIQAALALAEGPR